MLSPYRKTTNGPKKDKVFQIQFLDVNSHHEHDLKRPQMTANDLKISQKIELNKVASNSGSTTKKAI